LTTFVELFLYAVSDSIIQKQLFTACFMFASFTLHRFRSPALLNLMNIYLYIYIYIYIIDDTCFEYYNTNNKQTNKIRLRHFDSFLFGFMLDGTPGYCYVELLLTKTFSIINSNCNRILLVLAFVSCTYIYRGLLCGDV